jgi:hypothetical protein
MGLEIKNLCDKNGKVEFSVGWDIQIEKDKWGRGE